MREAARPADLPARDRLSLLLSGLPLLVAVVAFVLTAPTLERWTVQQRMRSMAHAPFDSSLVLIGVGPSVTEGLPEGAAVPRGHLADMLTALVRYRPAVVAVDYRMGPREAQMDGFEAVQTAVSAASAAGVEVVLPTTLGRVGPSWEVTYGPDSTLGSVRAGFVTFEGETRPNLRGIGGSDAPPLVLRSAHARRLVGGDVALSFPLVTVAAYEDALPERRAARRSFAPRLAATILAETVGVAPDEAVSVAERRAYLRFAGPYGDLGSDLTYVASDALVRETDRQQLPPSWFEGKIVVVAEVSPSPDGFDSVEAPYGVVRGGVLLLHTIDTLLTDGGPAPPPWPVGWALTGLALGVGVWAGSWPAVQRSWWAVGAGFGTAVVGCGVYVWLCFGAIQGGLVLPLVAPLASFLAAAVIGFVVGRPVRFDGSLQ